MGKGNIETVLSNDGKTRLKGNVGSHSTLVTQAKAPTTDINKVEITPSNTAQQPLSQKFSTYSNWEKKYQPIKNHFIKNGDQLSFETFGAEAEFVENTDVRYVWTEVSSDEGSSIVPGFAYVNRLHYFITKEPWDNELLTIPTWYAKDCECIEDEKYEVLGYNPHCEKCDEGKIDIDCDSVEGLKKLFGETAIVTG